MRYILALDPSGNFHEGKGTTGWVLIDANKKTHFLIKEGTIEAKDYSSMMEYFRAHINLLEHINYTYGSHLRTGREPWDRLHIVIEDYRLYGSKVHSQINSNLETSQLIGLLKYWCYMHGIKYKMQMASEVKTRWSDTVLAHYDVAIPKSRHAKDALRHAMHYSKFGRSI